MSSISVYELKNILSKYPDDYEVIIELKKYNEYDSSKLLTSIAYINGVKSDDDYKEIRLMN